MTSVKTYPVQSRLLSEDEKTRASARARINGMSLSAFIRVLLQKAEREDYRIELGKPKKRAG